MRLERLAYALHDRQRMRARAPHTVPGGATHVGALLFTLGTALGVIALVAALGLPMSVRSAGPIDASVADARETPAPPSAPPPVPELFHSEWYTQSADPDLTVGAIGDVTVQLRNVGSTRWVRGTKAEVRLGEVGDKPLPPDMRVDWAYPDRPAVQSEPVVDEYGLATFSFKVRGVAPGEFVLRLRPVVDGVKWLEDDGILVTIHVLDG
jgi:hypothetical protein